MKKQTRDFVRRLTAVAAAVILITANAGAAAPDTAQAQSGLVNFRPIKAYDNAFTDIEGHWAEELITRAYTYGIVCGIGGGLYNPEGEMTVAEAITIAAQIHMTYTYGDGAEDVRSTYTAEYAAGDGGHWAAPYLRYTLDRGLISHDWDGLLDTAITRGETVGIWSRLLRPWDMTAINTVHSLPDVKLGTPYAHEIVGFYEAGIVRGSTENGVEHCFLPEDHFSRAEAAAVFMSMTNTEQRQAGQSYGTKTVALLAGTGSGGFSDKTPLLSSFTLPHGMAADAEGGILVFDTYNHALRRLDDQGVQTLSEHLPQEGGGLLRGGYRDGELSQALFNLPTDGVYSGTGDLFVCDSENHVIRLLRGGRVYTFAGTLRGYQDGAGDSARFDTPTAMAMDNSGNLYIADTLNDCIRKIDQKGVVTTIAGTAGQSGYQDGKATASLFRNPSGIAVSEDGQVVYVADTGNHCIRTIKNGRVTTLSGFTAEADEDGDPMGGYADGRAKAAMFNLPKGLALAGDILFVADSGNNVIRAVNSAGQAFTAAGTGEPGDREGSPLTAAFCQPSGLLWLDGILYIADTTNNLIKTLSVDLAAFAGGAR